ncbi:MAG: hypothetical protein ACRDDY_17145 [Clostridium sp.]|uniref:hypothetical protein n=1 Tax=Clostridium sp. TaxID=1506 RepID=UPI003EE49757
MNNIKLITTDSGKKFGKGTCDGKNILRFESKLDILEKPDYSYKNMIELKNKYYLLGSEADTISYDSTKELMLHKLSVYYNICQHISTYGERVNLVVNMPITQYMDTDQRDNFKRYIKDEQEIEMKIGMKTHLFIINDVLPVAEGTGIIFSQPHLFKDKSAIICNIGGLNSTCLQVNDRKIVRSSPFNANLGGNILESDIRKELNRNGKFNFQPHEIPFLFSSENPYIKDCVTFCVEKLLDGIITEMKSKNYNTEGCDNIYFEGGTSLRLKNVIEANGFKVVEDPINQDIIGSHKFGVKYFAN